MRLLGIELRTSEAASAFKHRAISPAHYCPALISASIAVINTDQKQCGEEGFISAFSSQSIIEGSQSKELKEGAWKQSLGAEAEIMEECCLLAFSQASS